MGSVPWWPVISGGEKMQCMPCSIARDMACRFDLVVLFVAALKSSINTSSRCVGDVGHLCGSNWFIILSSNLCGLKCILLSIRNWITLQTVSEAEQKNDGDSHWPIWRLLGTTIMMPSLGTSSCWGRT
eukprot:15354021-Ditylum_brightwellii.AAC.4